MKHYHLPASASGIYVLTRAGRVVYIGRSVNIYARLGAHAKHKMGSFDELIFFEIPAALIARTEKNLIATFRPELNEVQYRADMARPCSASAIQAALRSEYGVLPPSTAPATPTRTADIRAAKKREMEARLARLSARETLKETLSLAGIFSGAGMDGSQKPQ